MPITALDPKSALIIVDLQRGIVELAGADALKPVIQNSSLLATAFRRRRLPDCSIANIFPRLGETGSTKDIVGLLDQQ